MLYLSPVTERSLPSIISFCQENFWRAEWSDQLLEIFFTNLISSLNLIFDIQKDGNRVAIGVLLDKVENKGRHSNCHILAKADSVDEIALINFVLEIAKENLPAKHNRIQFSVEAGINAEKTLASHNFHPYFSTYEMSNSNHSGIAKIHPTVLPFKECDSFELYSCMKRAFEDNIDFNLSPFESWENSRRENAQETWVIKEKNEIIAFLTGAISENNQFAEIGTIGVLPDYRRQGMAKQLLEHALCTFTEKGVLKSMLYVSAQNTLALSLYKKLGFVLDKQFDQWLWEDSHKHKKLEILKASNTPL